MLKHGHGDIDKAFEKSVEDLDEYLKTHDLNDFLKSFLITLSTYATGSSKIKEHHINDMVRVVKNNSKEDLSMTLAQKWKNEGIEKGREDGILIGEEKKATEIARNLKRLGIDVNAIVEATGLSKEEIDSIYR